MANRKALRPDGEQLAQLKATGMTNIAISRKFNITPATVQGAIRHYEKSNKVSQLFNVDFGKPLVLCGNAIVAGDVHVPTTNYEFAKLLITVAKRFNIKILIIAGDMFNFDMFSNYPSMSVGTSWADERDAGRALVQHWLSWFDELYFLMGNHDRRMIKWSMGNLDDTDIFGLITSSPKAHTSNFGYCTINSGGIPWLITHAKEYSVNQLVVADQLAQKYDINIISHHEHHVAHGYDRFKKHVIINNGGLFDKDKMPYVKLDTTKRPDMANAFTALVNGCAKLYTPDPRFTDWDEICP